MTKKLNELLVIADMDNTLLTATKGVPPCNIETLRLFCSLGGNFTVASGRSVESIRAYLHELPLTVPAIAYGGGMIYDFAKEQAINIQTIRKTDAKKAILEIMAAFPKIGLEIMAENGKIYVIQANSFTYEHTLYEKLSYVNCELDDIKCGWIKVLFTSTPTEMCKLAAFCNELHFHSLCFIATNDIYYEIMPIEVSKGVALETLRRKLNISKENVIAIGDYYNDISLFNEAGYSVAMSNAPIAVQMAADEVTAECMEGGAGQFIYKLIKQYS